MIAVPETAAAAVGPRPWVINVARGSLIDTDALVTALRDDRIGGIELDVTDPERVSSCPARPAE